MQEWIDEGHALVVVPGEVPAFASKAALAGDDKYLDEWFEWNNVSAATRRPSKIPMAELAPEPRASRTSTIGLPKDSSSLQFLATAGLQ